MSIYIIGIDGLDLGIVNQYINKLPNFQKLKDEGYLGKIKIITLEDFIIEPEIFAWFKFINK